VNVLGPRLALRRVATPLAPTATIINLLWHERTQQDPAQLAFRDLLAGAVGSRRSGQGFQQPAVRGSRR